MIPVVAGSNPVGHPKFPRKWQQPRIEGTPAAACRVLIDAALAQITANVPGAIDGRDPEYLHQLRVGIRRLRTLFRILKARRLDRRLRKLALPLGEARNWDVFVERFGRGRAQQRAAHAKCRRVLRSAEFREFFAQRFETRTGKASFARFADEALERLRRKALQRARKMDWRDEERRHRLRIAVRRLRYASEFFSVHAEDLARLQDLLGELNDIAVARGFGGPEHALERRERALISELATAWRSWAGRERPRAAAR